MSWLHWLSMDQAQADQRCLIEAMRRHRLTQVPKLDQDGFGQLDLESGLAARLRIQARGGQAIFEWSQAIAEYDCPPVPEFGVDTLQSPCTVVWRSDMAELVRFGNRNTARLLWVPAPINKANILDLTPERSVVQRQLDLGLDVYVVVWRGACEQHAPGIEDYVRTIIQLGQLLGPELNLAGYCLGGAMAAMASQHIDSLGSLSLVAAPMDGQAGALTPWLTPAQCRHTQAMADIRGMVPAGVLAAGFVGLKPEAWRGLFQKGRTKALTQWVLDGMNLSPGVWWWITDQVYGAGVFAQTGPFRVPTWVQSFDDDHLVPPQQLASECGVIHARAPGGHNGGVLRVQPGQWLDGWVQWLPKPTSIDPIDWPDLGHPAHGYIAQRGSAA